MERFSIHSIDAKLLDTSIWPDVLRSQLSEKDREIYDMRRRAIELLILGMSRKEIAKQTGVDRKSVLQFFKRCITTHPDGRLYGFRALIPNTRIAPYRRRKEFVETKVGTQAGASGAFGKFLRENPDIEEMIRRHVFQLSKRTRVYEGPVRIKSLHKRMIDMCRAKGLDKPVGQR
jgi:putative transposase